MSAGITADCRQEGRWLMGYNNHRSSATLNDGDIMQINDHNPVPLPDCDHVFKRKSNAGSEFIKDAQREKKLSDENEQLWIFTGAEETGLVV